MGNKIYDFQLGEKEKHVRSFLFERLDVFFFHHVVSMGFA